jgi:hypothetical protein
MEKYSKSYKLTKTFRIKGIRCGLLTCDGSNHGAGNATTYGTICESRACFLLTSFTSCCLTSSAEVNVHLWELAEYQDQDAGLPAFIDPEWIKGQVAMTTVSIGENRTKVWATVDLAKVRILYMPCYLFVDLRLQ